MGLDLSLPPTNNAYPFTGTTTVYGSENSVIAKNIKNEPQDYNLPDLGSDTATYNKLTKDNHQKTISFVDDTTMVRVTDTTKLSSTVEFGVPGNALLQLKISKDEPNGKAKVSFDSPYGKDYARDKGQEFIEAPLKRKIYEPLKESMGKTVADTTVSAVAFAAVMSVSRHLPGGNAKLNVPGGNLLDDNLKARVILGYGDGNNPKVKGFDLKREFFVNNEFLSAKKIDVRAVIEKKTDGPDKKESIERGIELNMHDSAPRHDSPYLGMYFKKSEVTGRTIGVSYELNF
jgi:hypothetical protein